MTKAPNNRFGRSRGAGLLRVRYEVWDVGIASGCVPKPNGSPFDDYGYVGKRVFPGACGPGIDDVAVVRPLLTIGLSGATPRRLTSSSGANLRTRILPLLLLLLSLPCFGGNALSEFKSSRYRSEPIPPAWIPPEHSDTIRVSTEYPREPVRSLLIRDFVKIYGIPDHFFRRLSPIGRWGALVYDLAGGYNIVVFVLDTDQPNFGGAQLFRPDGDAEGPLIK
jgi:hypothetical protein